jgi:hypothetical protein
MTIIYLLLLIIILILSALILYYFKFKTNINGGAASITNNRWFNSNNLTKLPNITVDEIYGYVLPHASTKYTGAIISHTLRFKPTIKFKKAIIFYYPVSEYKDIEDIDGKNYYHEYYVPWQSCLYLLDLDIVEYIPFNIRLNKVPPIEFSTEVLIIISSEFSHFYPFYIGFQLENKAAHALMHKNIDLALPWTKIIDDYRTYQVLFDYIPTNYYLKWIGHDRSDTNGVGYMSFLLLSTVKKQFDGLFVTVYDAQMDAHECLGSWDKNVNEEEFIQHTLKSATVSRLTNGKKIGTPIKFITITYLHKELNKTLPFIRGWHSIYAYGAFYLSDVLLEHSYPNGNWIKQTDTEWQSDNNFKLSDTFDSLKKKSNTFDSFSNLQLYYSEIKTITN